MSHSLGNKMVNSQKTGKKTRKRVLVDRSVSDWRPVFSGVTQGSVLGQLLLLVRMNDLGSNIVSQVVKFADDTKLYSGNLFEK